MKIGEKKGRQYIILAFVLALLLLNQTTSMAQEKPNLARLDKFFPEKEAMPIGTYYYPEHWPSSQWERDIKAMAGFGFEFTHFAEFAWARLEPEEGKFNFSWLDSAVGLAAKYNLKVVMCTPTPCPPAWLVEKYPEVLMHGQDGRSKQHGSREHYSWSSKKYRQLSARIVEEMAKRYGKDKRIWGWQLDNEPSHYGHYDYGPAATEAFRIWLKQKYGTITALNNAWGNAFWSLNYNNFEQIRIPNANELVVQPNPTAILDFKRFSANECASYLNEQTAIIRRYCGSDQFITTNYMSPGSHTPVNPSLTAPGFDLTTFTSYPVSGVGTDETMGEEGFRLGNPANLTMNHDLARMFNGATGVMELQPGQVNWGRFNTQPLPGAIRMWMWQCFAQGSKLLCNYRLRTPRSGAEQYYSAVLGPDGVTPLRGGAEWIAAMNEIKAIRKELDMKAVPDPKTKGKRAAMYWNFDNIWDLQLQKQTSQWNTEAHFMRYYNALRRAGTSVDFVSEKMDISGYDIVVAPAYQLVNTEILETWKKYAQEGGNLILTCRTGQKDKNAQLWEQPWAGPIRELIGGAVSYYDHLPDNRTGKIAAGPGLYEWNNWAEVLEPKAGTETLANFTSLFYKGKSAAIRNKMGKGTVSYIGVDTDNGQLETDLVAKIITDAKIKTSNLPEGVYINYRSGLYIAFSYSDKPFNLPIPADAKILVGKQTIEQAGVTVWKEKGL